jgi:hypothetical protein
MHKPWILGGRVFALARVFLIVLIALLAVSGPARLWAQQADSTLAGNVLDQADRAVPNAAVVVKNDASSVSKNTTTNDEGHFEVTGLPSASIRSKCRRRKSPFR